MKTVTDFENCENFKFIKYPKILNEADEFKTLSVEARLLFAMILDRMKLSELNSDRFTDENGNIYIFFSTKDICEKLGCGKTKATSVLKELASRNLIFKRKCDFNMPPRITVPVSIMNSLLSVPHSTEKRSSESTENGFTNNRKSSTINTNIINNNTSNTESSVIEMTEKIKEQIEYDCLHGDMNVIENIASIMASFVLSPPKSITINGIAYSGNYVAQRLLTLTAEEIQHVLFTLEEIGAKVRNPRAYIISLLFNSPAAVALENAAIYNLEVAAS